MTTTTSFFDLAKLALDTPEQLAFLYIYRPDEGPAVVRSILLSNDERLSMATTQRLLREFCEGKLHFFPAEVGLAEICPGAAHEFFYLDIRRPPAFSSGAI